MGGEVVSVTCTCFITLLYNVFLLVLCIGEVVDDMVVALDILFTVMSNPAVISLALSCMSTHDWSMMLPIFLSAISSIV